MEHEWDWWSQGVQTASLGADEDMLARLSRARALIASSYAQPLDLDALARQACYSRYHFLRAYQRAYGLTPHQDLTRRRLRAARQLLARTDGSVTDICYAVGFRSLGSFSSLFKRHSGVSPVGWRRRIFPAPWIAPPPVPGCILSRFAIFEKPAPPTAP